MLNVQKYLIENGLQKLQDEFHIEIHDYPDRISLNYSQIDSIKNHPICDECRGLILRKDPQWTVIARSFNRFFNVGETDTYKSVDITKCKVQEKLDGSLLSLAWDRVKWQCSTRKMCFAEGETITGISFANIFEQAVKDTKVYEVLNQEPKHKDYTWIFELCSPLSRIVTPYSNTFVALTGARNKITDNESLSSDLDQIAEQMGVRRPKEYKCSTLKEIEDMAIALPAMDEGFVIVMEQHSGSHVRMKCKNPKYLAIAHLNNNGAISPKRILKLVMENDTAEFLSYFPEHKPYFDFVQQVWVELVTRIQATYDEHKSIKSQKDFALAIIPKCKYSFESGIMFQARKSGQNLVDIMRAFGHDKVSKGMGLKGMFQKQFKIQLEEE